MPHAAERAKELSEGLLRRCSSVNRRRIAKSHFDRIRKPRDQLLDNERVGIAKKSARPIVVGSSRSGISVQFVAPILIDCASDGSEGRGDRAEISSFHLGEMLLFRIASFGNAFFGEPERKRQREIALLVLADDIFDPAEFIAADSIEYHAGLGFESYFFPERNVF